MGKHLRKQELRLRERQRSSVKGKRGDETRTPGSMNPRKSTSIKEAAPWRKKSR